MITPNGPWFSGFPLAMAPTPFQRAIAILCVLAFGLGQAMLAPLAVRCIDADGNARLEYACITRDGGGCGSASEQAIDDEAALAGATDRDGEPPCDDVPLAGEVGAARAGQSGPVVDQLVAMVAVAMVLDGWTWRDAISTPALPRVEAAQRPPDWIAHARSIVLLV